MSEYTENENVMDEALEAAEETVEETEEIVEAEEAADEETEQAEEAVAEEQDRDAILFDKAQRAARLLRNRRDAISKEADTKAERMSDMVRALKLLELKPKMEQKEMADLLGMSLRALDELMAKAEAEDLVGRIESEEDDKRKVVVFAAEGAVEAAANAKPEKDHYVPSLSDEKIDEICAMLDEIINPLTEMGLDNDRRDGRGGFGGRDDRRGGDRGGRGGFGGRGGDRGGRGGFGKGATIVAVAALIAIVILVALMFRFLSGDDTANDPTTATPPPEPSSTTSETVTSEEPTETSDPMRDELDRLREEVNSIRETPPAIPGLGGGEAVEATIPEAAGKSPAEVELALRRAGFGDITILDANGNPTNSLSSLTGTVATIDPPAGSTAMTDQPVTITLQ